METIEKLFTGEFVCDKKHKLNTNSSYVITSKLLDTLESGVTSEWLESLDTDIFKYNTQITIHGIFEKEFNPYEYKLCFLNKNKSLGVKWVAIDLDKKKRIAKSLAFCGFHFYFKTTESYFNKYKEFKTLDEMKDIISEFKNQMDKLDKSLFNGNYTICAKRDMYGRTFIDIDLSINAILECHIATLINQLGGESEEIVLAREKEKEIAWEQEQEKRRLQRIEQEKKDKEKLELLNQALIEFNINRFKLRNQKDDGIFFYACNIIDGVIKFRKIKIWKEKRTYYFRKSDSCNFEDLQSIEVKPEYSYYESKFNIESTKKMYYLEVK